RGQRCLNHPIDYIEHRLNGPQYPQLSLCRLRRSHQRYNHDSGKRHRRESPVVLRCHHEPGKRCEKRHVQKNLHFLRPPETTQGIECSPLPFSIAAITRGTPFTSPEISSSSGETSARPCGNLLASSW